MDVRHSIIQMGQHDHGIKFQMITFGHAARTENSGTDRPTRNIPLETGGYIGVLLNLLSWTRLIYAFHVKLEFDSDKHVVVWLINDSKPVIIHVPLTLPQSSAMQNAGYHF